MANDLLFPSGQAYSDLTGRPGVKVFAVDDVSNPAVPVPGFVVLQLQASNPGSGQSPAPGSTQPFTFDQAGSTSYSFDQQ